jgi:hypothetical protein
MAAKAATQATNHMTMAAIGKMPRFQCLDASILYLAWVAAFAAMTIL